MESLAIIKSKALLSSLGNIYGEEYKGFSSMPGGVKSIYLIVIVEESLLNSTSLSCIYSAISGSLLMIFFKLSLSVFSLIVNSFKFSYGK